MKIQLRSFILGAGVALAAATLSEHWGGESGRLSIALAVAILGFTAFLWWTAWLFEDTSR